MANFQNLNIDDTGFLQLPTGTTAQRPSSPSVNDMRFNTDFNLVEYYTGSQWRFPGRPYLWYDEGPYADLYLNNWNNNTTFYMECFGELGPVTAHGWNDGPADYTLTLNNIPPHQRIKYQVLFHGVDSLDNETTRLYVQDGNGNDKLIYRSTRNSGQANGPSISFLDSDSTRRWSGTRLYDFTPWAGGTRDGNGFDEITTGWIDHTRSDFYARHELGANQDQDDEAQYLSHVKIWLD